MVFKKNKNKNGDSLLREIVYNRKSPIIILTILSFKLIIIKKSTCIIFYLKNY